MYRSQKRTSEEHSNSRRSASRATAHLVGMGSENGVQQHRFLDNRPQTRPHQITAQLSQNSVAQLAQKKRKRKVDPDDDKQRVVKKRRLANYYLNKNFKFSLDDNDDDKKIYVKHVDSLIDGLDDDRVKLEKFLNLERQGKKTYRRKKVSNFILNSMRNITEKVGELSATQYMDQNYDGAKLIYGFGKGTGFDQVYEKDDKVYIVEAKGPGAKLGVSDRKGKQMSQDWVRLTTRGLSDVNVRKKIQVANRRGKLRGLVISATPGGNAPKKALKYRY